MKSIEKGEVAQLKAELRAVEKGFVVARPLTIARYDLLVDDGTKIHRVQVKYAGGVSTRNPNACIASLNYTDRAKVEHTYTRNEVDAFVIYLPKIDEILWMSDDKVFGKSKVAIRIEGKPRSNSLWYEDYIW